MLGPDIGSETNDFEVNKRVNTKTNNYICFKMAGMVCYMRWVGEIYRIETLSLVTKQIHLIYFKVFTN